MKKIIIIAAAAVVLTAGVTVSVLKNGAENTVSAETVVMSLDDYDFGNVEPLSQDGADAAVIIDTRNRIEAMLSDLDWVGSADVNISEDKATAVLDVTREPSAEEIDGAAQLIAMSVDGLEKEDVTILDKNSNVLYS